jgi:hypothetical protein
MKLSTVVASLVLAVSSSFAAADPAVTFGYPSPAPQVRDHRAWSPEPEAQYPRNTKLFADYSLYVGSRPYETIRWFRRPEWIPLTQPTRIDRGREVFFIGAGAGRLSALRLFNNFGHSHIRFVTIEFADGGFPQMVRLDRELDASGSITIDLAGRSRIVKKVIVYGATARGSSYQLLGH